MVFETLVSGEHLIYMILVYGHKREDIYVSRILYVASKSQNFRNRLQDHEQETKDRVISQWHL